MSLFQTAVRRPVTTALVFVAIVIVGLFSLSRLSTDLLPNIETGTIMVVTSYAGAGAEDIENTISRPIENTLNSVSNLKHIRSSSRDNISTVYLEFESGTNMEVATNDIRDKLDMIKNALPEEANAPFIFKFSTEDIPIMLISAQAQESRNGLDKILEDKVSNRLARLGGVGAVSVMGAPLREINIYCNPQKLEAYNITVEQVAQAISLSNRNVPIGTIDVGSQTSAIRLQGELSDARDINHIIVSSVGGKEVFLKDVAEVYDGPKERLQESYTNGFSSAVIMIRKQSGANSVEICKKIHKELPDIEDSLPSDVHLQMVFDTSDNITKTIESLLKTIAITFAVVILVVLFFLGRWRATFIIVLTIPISLVASLIYLFASGNTLNIISMSALSIAIGMVVDDAIVVLENITRHIERGSFPKQAAVYATNEVALSVIASTLTMLAVFLPLTMISGFIGVLFKQLGWVVSIVMIVSTLAALSLSPMLSSQLLRRTQRNSATYDWFFSRINKWLRSLETLYARTLNYCVRHRKRVLVGAVLLFVGSLPLFLFLKTEFMPQADNGYIRGTIEFPQGTSMATTKAFALEWAEETRHKYEDNIRMINFSVGQPDDANTTASAQVGANVLNINIAMKGYEERTMTTDEMLHTLKKDLSEYPELSRVDLAMGNGGTGSSAVVMEIYGYSIENTTRVAQEFKSLMEASPSCGSVTLSRKPSTPEYRVVFDDAKLAFYGLSKSAAASALRSAVTGAAASAYREDGNEYDIKVRYAPEFRATLGDIENILVRTPAGGTLRMRDLGWVEQSFAPPTIERRDRERYVDVSLSVAPRHAMSDLVKEAQEAISKVDLPDGVTWKLGGDFESQQESFKDLFTLMILINILVFIVMAAEFESLTDPFVIMFSVPFAFTGVLIGLTLTSTPMGLMALVGLVMLIGIVVKNGIVLIDYMILCRDRGMGIIQSVVEAGRSRLRPVLMTTATTVLGMIPLAVGTGEGSEMWQSMGMTVAFGLTFSTLITLLLIPTLYATVSGIRMKKVRRKAQRRRVQRQREREQRLSSSLPLSVSLNNQSK